MDYIPVPDVAQVELIYTLHGQRIQNVLHYAREGGWTDAYMFDLADSVAATYAAGNLTVVPTDLVLTRIRVTDLTTQTGGVLEYDGILPIAGTGASPALPGNVAVVLTKRTAKRGRSYRGRVYWGGIAENTVTGNTASSTHIDLIKDIFEDMKSYTIGAEGVAMVVISRFENKLPRVTGEKTVVTNFTSDYVVDSQRRRLSGRGN